MAYNPSPTYMDDDGTSSKKFQEPKIKNVKINITDVHNQDHEFEGNLHLTVDGVNTVITKGMKIVGVFANVCAAKLEEINE